MSNVKMSDVFELPVSCECVDDIGVRDFMKGESEMAAYAINNHDSLTARVSELEGALQSMLNLNVKLIESHNKKNPPWEMIDMEHCQDADRLLNKNKG